MKINMNLIKIIYFAIIIMIVLSGCAQKNFNLDDYFSLLKNKINLPVKKKAALSRLPVLEEMIDKAIQNRIGIKIKLNNQRYKLLLLAISHYQLYYFIRPDPNKAKKLKIFYIFFDKLKKLCTNEKIVPKSFYDLRNLINIVFNRSKKAKKNVYLLLKFWKTNTDSFNNFLKKLQQPWEVGGVILSINKKLKIQFINNKIFSQIKYSLEKFKQNNFEDIDFLEGQFIRRLILSKVRALKSSKIYYDVIIDASKKKFAIIRELSKKKILNKTEKKILKQAKKKLYFFGLSRKLLKHTYSIDTTPYVNKAETAFFFHTHPYNVKLNFPKKPSGQDEAMTFRTGPSLVFDIQKKHIDLYLVILGKSKKVTRFYKKGNKYQMGMN